MAAPAVALGVKPVFNAGLAPLPGLKLSAWWNIDAQVEVPKKEKEQGGAQLALPAVDHHSSAPVAAPSATELAADQLFESMLWAPPEEAAATLAAAGTSRMAVAEPTGGRPPLAPNPFSSGSSSEGGSHVALQWAVTRRMTEEELVAAEALFTPVKTWPFRLDTFQREAIARMELEGPACALFVAAHTSAGKTLVAEYAIALAQRNRLKCIYTAVSDGPGGLG